MDETVGIRDLKNRLSEVLRRVREGASVIITDRNRPIALLLPAPPASMKSGLESLAHAGLVAWAGGKPSGCGAPPRVRGATVGDAVLNDRR
jgi:prevent-host-death family protein